MKLFYDKIYLYSERKDKEADVMLKKKFIALLSASVLAVTTAATACIISPAAVNESEQNAVAEYSYQLRKETEYDSLYTKNATQQLIGVNYDQLYTTDLTDPDTGKPMTASSSAISSALEAVNKEVRDDDKPFVKQNAKAARRLYRENKKDGTFAPFVCTDTLTPVRSDSTVLSIKRNRYINADGAHGFRQVTALSFDLQTGKRLSLKDVLSYRNNSELSQTLANAVLKKYKASVFDTDAVGIAKRIKSLIKGDKYYSGSNDTKYLTWYLSRNGVTFFFNQYDIASYAAGTFSVTLSASKYPDMVKPGYTASSDSFIRDVKTHGDKVNGRKLSFKEKWDNDGFVTSLTIRYGKKSLKLTPYVFDYDAKLVSVPSGNYLYISTRAENDYQSLYVIDLGAKKLSASTYDFGFYDMIPTDPDHMIFASRGFTLGTIQLYRSYRVGTDGAPVANTKYYLADSPKLTLKKNVTLDVLDGTETDTTHQKAFAKGTTMHIFRITEDGRTADCLTDGGDLIRLGVDTDSYPQKINGTYDEDELIDGASFAG